jgi:hypothetical protein
MSKIELALVKHVRISKKFYQLDVAAPSHGLCGADATMTHTAQVPAFDNLGDDSCTLLPTAPTSTQGECVITTMIWDTLTNQLSHFS